MDDMDRTTPQFGDNPHVIYHRYKLRVGDRVGVGPGPSFTGTITRINRLSVWVAWDDGAGTRPYVENLIKLAEGL